MIASLNGHAESVKILIEAEAQVNTQDKVIYAASTSRKILHNTSSLQLKGELTVCFCSQDGWTALHLAAQEGRIDVVRLLIEAQAQVNVQSEVHSSIYTDLPSHYWCTDHTLSLVLPIGLLIQTLSLYLAKQRREYECIFTSCMYVLLPARLLGVGVEGEEIYSMVDFLYTTGTTSMALPNVNQVGRLQSVTAENAAHYVIIQYSSTVYIGKMAALPLEDCKVRAALYRPGCWRVMTMTGVWHDLPTSHTNPAF